ncbi:MAG: single-stranded DNA-binding protein [Anaerolineaceae bacterium]
MSSLNRIQLIGRLGKDPETRTTPGGKQVCIFSVAVGHHWKDKKGEAKSVTDWFNIEAWGKLGEICQQYLHKGQLVFVEGRMKTDKYEQNGETRYFTKVVLSGMQMLERREADEVEEQHEITEEEAEEE